MMLMAGQLHIKHCFLVTVTLIGAYINELDAQKTGDYRLTTLPAYTSQSRDGKT
jgi:hypothetical protein